MAHQMTPKAKSSAECCQTTPNFNLDGLDELFQKLSDGQVPDFLSLMTAINDISSFYTGAQEPCLDCRRS